MRSYIDGSWATKMQGLPENAHGGPMAEPARGRIRSGEVRGVVRYHLHNRIFRHKRGQTPGERPLRQHPLGTRQTLPGPQAKFKGCTYHGRTLYPRGVCLELCPGKTRKLPNTTIKTPFPDNLVFIRSLYLLLTGVIKIR